MSGGGLFRFVEIDMWRDVKVVTAGGATVAAVVNADGSLVLAVKPNAESAWPDCIADVNGVLSVADPAGGVLHESRVHGFSAGEFIPPLKESEFKQIRTRGHMLLDSVGGGYALVPIGGEISGVRLRTASSIDALRKFVSDHGLSDVRER